MMRRGRSARGRVALVGAAVVAGSAALGWDAMRPVGDAVARVHAGTGVITGVVRFEGSVTYAGEVPEGRPIDMSADSYCAEQHEGERVVAQTIVTGAEGRLADVVVHVKQGLAGKEYPVPEESVLLDQRGCLYAPHVLAARAGQTVVIRNSDETLHNVHVTSRNNRGFNIGQPIKGIESKRSFRAPEVGIDVRCDIHGWMQAWIGVFDHPFHAVTAPDGRFSFEGLPPGEYVVEAWHETLGSREMRVTVDGATPSDASFEFEG